MCQSIQLALNGSMRIYSKCISRERYTGFLDNISNGRRQIKYLKVNDQVYITAPIILQVTRGVSVDHLQEEV